MEPRPTSKTRSDWILHSVPSILRRRRAVLLAGGSTLSVMLTPAASATSAETGQQNRKLDVLGEEPQAGWIAPPTKSLVSPIQVHCSRLLLSHSLPTQTQAAWGACEGCCGCRGGRCCRRRRGNERRRLGWTASERFTKSARIKGSRPHARGC